MKKNMMIKTLIKRVIRRLIATAALMMLVTTLSSHKRHLMTELDRESLFESRLDTYIDSVYQNSEKRRYPYRCPAGYLTVGVGHKFNDETEAESLTYPLSDRDIKKILRKDFETKMLRAKEIHPDLSGWELIAITDFICSIGQGAYSKSSVRREVDEGVEPTSILKYVWFKSTSGEYVRANSILRKRQRQLEVFRKGV